MSHEVLKFLFDMRESVTIIETHLSSVPDLATYKNELKTIDAVERRLAIIGEALNKANKLQNDLVISNKPRIISLRHILVHDYDLIDDETIWTICKKYLPVLKEELKTYLDS